ncbi:MAG: hypothetical protein H0X62_13920 [Bacteroidetes bacterium]|nr:hypothetical protein [Bacteroidota bacterium]
MKKIIPLFAILFIALTFLQCKKNKETYTFHASQSRDSVNVISLFINEKAKGNLPYQDTISDCAEGNYALVDFYHGKNNIELKNSAGKTFYTSTITIRNNSHGGSSGKGNGGQMMTNILESPCKAVHFFNAEGFRE